MRRAPSIHDYPATRDGARAYNAAYAAWERDAARFALDTDRCDCNRMAARPCALHGTTPREPEWRRRRHDPATRLAKDLTGAR